MTTYNHMYTFAFEVKSEHPEGEDVTLLNAVFGGHPVKNIGMFDKHAGGCLAPPLADEPVEIFIKGKGEFRLAAIKFDHPWQRLYAGQGGIKRCL